MINVNFLGVFNCYTHTAPPDDCLGASSRWKARLPHHSGQFNRCAQAFPVAVALLREQRCREDVYAKPLQLRWGGHKINVNCFAPGILGTAMWELIDEKLGEIEGRQKGDSLEKYSTDMTDMGRVSVLEDVAKVVRGFLCKLVAIAIL
jgi:hypothetical protein